MNLSHAHCRTTDGKFDDAVDDALAGSSVNRIRLLEGPDGLLEAAKGSGTASRRRDGC
jgi:hypothetical protein